MRKAAFVRRHVAAVAGRVLLLAILTSPIVDQSSRATLPWLGSQCT
jgi:hypothetical protein